MQEYLEKNYDEELVESEEETIKLTLNALLEVVKKFYVTYGFPMSLAKYIFQRSRR